MKLHLGAGKSAREGWVNIDQESLPGIDMVFDLGNCKNKKLDLPDNSVDEFFGSHVIEHIVDTLPLMEELHRVAKPDALCEFHLPYGSSDDAWENPTHVRPYFLHSFGYFSQPFFWREDYGYKGDWKVEEITLGVKAGMIDAFNGDTNRIEHAINTLRNTVAEMRVKLRAVKPIREPLKENQLPVNVIYARAE